MSLFCTHFSLKNWALWIFLLAWVWLYPTEKAKSFGFLSVCLFESLFPVNQNGLNLLQSGTTSHSDISACLPTTLITGTDNHASLRSVGNWTQSISAIFLLCDKRRGPCQCSSNQSDVYMSLVARVFFTHCVTSAESHEWNKCMALLLYFIILGVRPGVSDILHANTLPITYNPNLCLCFWDMVSVNCPNGLGSLCSLGRPWFFFNSTALVFWVAGLTNLYYQVQYNFFF